MAEKAQLNQLREKKIEFALDELHKENKALLRLDADLSTTTTSTGDSTVVAAGVSRVSGMDGKAGKVRKQEATTSLLSSIHKTHTTASSFTDNSTLCPLVVDSSNQTDSGGL